MYISTFSSTSVLVLVFFSSDFFYAMKLTPSVPVQTHLLVLSVVYYSYQGSFMSDHALKLRSILVRTVSEQVRIQWVNFESHVCLK